MTNRSKKSKSLAQLKNQIVNINVTNTLILFSLGVILLTLGYDNNIYNYNLITGLAFTTITLAVSLNQIRLFLNKFENHVRSQLPDNQKSKVVNFIAYIGVLFLRKSHGVRQPLLNAPKDGGLVIVANHPCGGIEAAAIMALMPRKVSPLTTSQFNHIPFVKRFLDLWDPIYVHFDCKKQDNQNNNNKNTFNACVQAVKKGKTILIFPYGGTHPPTAQEPQFKTGAIRIAQAANNELLAESKTANVNLLPVFTGGFTPDAYGKPFGSLFKYNNITVKQYELISAKQLINNSHEDVSDKVLKPLLSMRFMDDGRFATRDDIHDEMALIANISMRKSYN